MKVITKTIPSKGGKENKKHLVYFFGLGESIKENNEGNNWGKWVESKKIDIHLFDYHYMESSYPEHFHNAKFYLKQALITAIVTSIILFTGYSIIASKMSTLAKVPIFMVFLIPAIIATIAMKFFIQKLNHILNLPQKVKTQSKQEW